MGKTKRVKKGRRVVVTVALFFASAAESREWIITGNHELSTTELQRSISHAHNAKQAAAIIVEQYRAAGIVSAQVQIQKQRGILLITEKNAGIKGPYAHYFSPWNVIRKDDIELSALRMTPAAAASRENVDLILTNSPKGIVLQTSAEGGQSWGGGALTYSNLGQRYSSADVINGYAYLNVGSGWRVDAGYTLGIPQWREDSQGGSYRSASLKLAMANEVGIFAGSLLDTTYRTGGAAGWLGQHGQISIYTLSHDYQFTRSLALRSALQHVKQNISLDAVSLDDAQRYESAQIGLSYNSADSWGSGVIFEQGITGNNDYNYLPVFSAFDHQFSRLEASTWYQKIIDGWRWTSGAGGQLASSGTPAAAQWIIGGPDRGRAYMTGFLAGARGAYISNVISAPERAQITPYFGADGGVVDTRLSGTEQAASVFAGAKARLWQRAALDASYAVGIGSAPGGADDERFLLTASMRM